jgi:hypothetical protein
MIKGSLKIILILIIILLFNFVEQYFSILIWFSFYLIGQKVSEKIYKSIPTKNYFDAFYFIFSFIGLLIIIDNYYNFGELAGFAGDDHRFLNGAKYLIGQYKELEMELSFFSYVLAIIALPISFFKEVSLTDLIPFNWFLAALIAVLINKLFFILKQRNIPLFIFVLAYPFQFIMTDSFSRLYRENLLIFFVIIATIEIFRKHNKKALFATIPIAILRVANITIVGLIFLFNRIRLKSMKWVIVITVLLMVLLTSSLPKVVQFAMMYGSDISRTERYKSAFSNLSSEEVIESRFSKNQSINNSLMANSYSDNSITSIGIRAAFSYFFPLRFLNPNSEMNHSRLGKVDGFYIYYVINWINTLSLVIVFPMLLIGVFKNKDSNILVIIASSATYLLIVLLISGQGRHTMGSYIFNSIIVGHGFFLIQSNPRLKTFFISSSIISFLFIIIYNIL